MKRIVLAWAALGAALLFSLACAMPALPALFPEPTATVRPTRTPRPTFTATPTQTPPPTNTPTPTRTNTPVPSDTPTQAPPTDTPVPPTATNTRRPVPPTATFTPKPPPPPAATATPSTEFSGYEGDRTNPAAFSCSQTMVVVSVVSRDGKPLAGYHVHYGQDGISFSVWDISKDVAKDPFGYNSSVSLNSDQSQKIYVTVFRDEVRPFDNSQSLSNEVTVNIEAKDLSACEASGNKNGGKVRIAPVVFVYNR